MVCVTQACLGACSILSILSIKTGRIVLWCHVLSLRRIYHMTCVGPHITQSSLISNVGSRMIQAVHATAARVLGYHMICCGSHIHLTCWLSYSGSHVLYAVICGL